MACNIDRAIDVLKTDKVLGDVVETLIERTLEKEQHKVEIAKASKKELPALRKARNEDTTFITAQVKKLIKATFDLSEIAEETTDTGNTLAEVIQEGRKAKTIPKVLGDALTYLFESIESIKFTETINDVFNPHRSIVSTDLPFSQQALIEEIETQDNPGKEFEKDYAEKASIFIEAMEKVVKKIYKTGFTVDAKLLTATPELAYLTKKSEDGKSLPKELANTLLRAAVKVVAGKTSTLAGETTFNPKIGKDTLGINYLNEADIEKLHGLGIPRSTLITQLAAVIKEDLDIEGVIEEQPFFVPSKKDGKEFIEVDQGKLFKELLAQQLAGVLVMEMENSEVLETNSFEKTTKGVSGEGEIKDVPFVRFQRESADKINFDTVNNANAAARLLPYVDTIFGKEPEKQGFYLEDDVKEPIQTKLAGGQELSDKSTKTLETIRDEITFEVNPGMLPILDLTPTQLLELFGINIKEVPPVALLELGFTKEEVSLVHYATVQPMWEVNQQYDRYIKAYHAVNDLGVLKYRGKILQKIETIRTLQMLQPVAKEALSMDAKIGNNTRTYLKVFGTASTQADKLLRHILQTSNMFKDITIDEESKKFGLWKVDMVQALGSFVPKGSKFIAEDKQTAKRSAEEFPGIVENIIKNHSDLMKIIDKLVVQAPLSDADIKSLGLAIDFTDGHTISGLMDLSRYLTAKNTPIGKKKAKAGKVHEFRSSVSAESDGATSGVAFKVAQNGTLNQAARLMLVTGQVTNTGLEQLKEGYDKNNEEDRKKIKVLENMIRGDATKGDPLATLPALNEAGITIQDAYQQTVLDFVKDIHDNNPALYKVLTKLYGQLLKADGVTVSKAGRDFAKQPQMQFLYGQQEEGLSDFVGSLAADNLVEQLMSPLQNKISKVEDLAELLTDINAAIASITDNNIAKESKYNIALENATIATSYIEKMAKKETMDKVAYSSAVNKVKAAVSILIGGELASSLKTTFKDFSEEDVIVKEAYEATFIMAEALRVATDMANDHESPVGMPKEYKDVVSSNINQMFDFNLGTESGQQLAVSKRGVDSSPYETGMSENSILEGGNKQNIHYGVNKEGKPRQISVRAPSPARTSAASFLLPGDTHNRDAVAMMSPIILLKINQIFDAAIASGTTRVAAEILADIGFYQETYKQKHIVDFALDAIERSSGMKGDKSTIPEAILEHLDAAIIKVARDNNLHKKYGTYLKIENKLTTLKADLAAAKVKIDNNKQEKIDDLKVLSQYGVNSQLVFEKGDEIVAVIFTANGVDTRIDSVLGKPIKGMSLNMLKAGIADYFSDTSFDDKNTGVNEHIADTNIVVEETISIIEEKLEAEIARIAKTKEVNDADSKAFADRITKKQQEAKEDNSTKEQDTATDEDLAYEQEIKDIEPEEEVDNPFSEPEMFKSLETDNINRILSDVEADEKSTISAKTAVDIFNDMVTTSSKPSEMAFLRNMMNTLIMPILEQNEFLLIDLLESKGIDTTGAEGHVSIRKDAHLDTIVIYHPTSFNGSDQSSTEVYVHELVHVFSKYLFSDTRISNSWVKEKKLIEGLFNQVNELITKDNYTDWFGDSSTAKAQYEHIFNQSNKNRALAEFTSYALSNAKFGQKMNLALHDLETGILNKSESNFTITEKLLNWVKSMVNKLFARKDKLATDMIRNILLETNGVAIKKKNILIRAVENVTQNLRTLDFKLRYYGKGEDEKNEILLRATAMLHVGRELIPDTLNKAADRGNLSILLADLLPSNDSSIPYVDHAIEARTKIANEPNIVQKEIMNKILRPDEKGNSVIDHAQDEELKAIVLDLDLQALYAVKGISIDDIMNLFLNKDDNVKDKLVKAINDVYKFNSTEMIALNKDIENLAEGLLLRKDSIEAHEGYTFINANQIAKLHAFKKTKSASSKGIDQLEILVDALASLYAIEKTPNHKLVTYSDTLALMDTAVEDVITSSHSIVSKVRDTNPKENASRIKGRYATVKDNTGYIVPVIETPFTVISSDYKEIDSYEISDGVRVAFYKVTRSVLQNRDKGSIGTIEDGDNSGVSILDAVKNPDVDIILKDIQKNKNIPFKEEMFIFNYNSKGDIIDIKLRVPELMEQENLAIDNRASITLAHAEGRYAEAQASHAYNDKWIKIANKDYEDNFSTNPKDFVWIGRKVKDKDLKGHYDILTDRMKRNLVNTPMAAGATEGIWVRKNTLRLNFGGQGKSVVNLLQTYGIDNRSMNQAVRFAERELLRISRVFKLEIVGKTYEVIMGNILSNILLETLKGRNPLEVAKTMFEGMIEIDKLNTYRKELASLKLEREASKNESTKYKLLRKMEKVQTKIDNSPVKYLDDAGFNSSFVEDIVAKDSVYLSEFEKKMYAKLGSSPGLKTFKKSFDFMYMNKGTVMGEAFNRMVIASDAGSRYATDVLDTKYMEEDIKAEFKIFVGDMDGYDGYSKRDKAEMFNSFRNKKVAEFEKRRKKDLLEQHIDYALRSGDILTALDKLSITPFFKFKQRIGKVLYKRYSDYPATAIVIGSFLAYVDGIESMTGVDFERAEESFWEILSETSGSPIDHLQEIASPAIWDNLRSMGLV